MCISYISLLKYLQLEYKDNKALLISLPQFAHAVLIFPLPFKLLFNSGEKNGFFFLPVIPGESITGTLSVIGDLKYREWCDLFSRKWLVCFNHSASLTCSDVFRLAPVQQSWFDPWLQSPAWHWSYLSIDTIGFPSIICYKSWFIHLSCQVASIGFCLFLLFWPVLFCSDLVRGFLNFRPVQISSGLNSPAHCPLQ